MIDIDFESYSELDLKDYGHWRYAAHPSTLALMLGIKFDKRPAGIIYGTKDGHPTHGLWIELFTRIRNGEEIWAFNTNFERAITELVAHRQWGMPIPKPEQWRDTQALCAMHALPLKLSKVCEVLQTTDQKDKRGKALINIFCKPNSKTGKRILPEEKPAEFAEFREYCIKDVETEFAVREKLPTKKLPDLEQHLWTLDSQINRRGVKIDRRLARGAIKITDEIHGDKEKQLPGLTGGLITGASQHARIKAFAAAQGYPVASTDEDAIKLALADTALPAPVRKVFEIRQALAGVAVKKYIKMEMCASPVDDRIRGVHEFMAADTGRWGGRMAQFQNIPKPVLNITDADREDIRLGDQSALGVLYPDVMIVLRDAIRNTIIANDGMVFDISDLASIEARVLGWITGEEGYLNAFKNKRDLYTELAAIIYGSTYEKIQALGKKSIERFVGKESILGLGYSMGAAKFIANTAEKGVVIDDAILIKAHVTYRQLYKKIVRFWYAIEEVCGRVIMTRKPEKFGWVSVEMIGTYLTIILPSGRRLWYPNAACHMTENPWGYLKPNITIETLINANTWGRTHTYGGKLTENIVQAIARDILACGIIKCHYVGLPVVLHVHDELVVEVPKAQSNPARLAAIMSEVPPWAPGLPLEAEAFSSPFYKK